MVPSARRRAQTETLLDPITLGYGGVNWKGVGIGGVFLVCDGLHWEQKVLEELLSFLAVTLVTS